VTESKLTRCPGCDTVFRITAEQLAFREGQVRCGHCRAVFDANEHFVSLDAAPPPDAFVPPGEEPREAGAGADDIAGGHEPAVDDSTDQQPLVGEAGVDEHLAGEAGGAASAEPVREAPVVEGEGDREPGRYDGSAGEEAHTLDASDIPSTDPVAAATGAADPATAASSEASAPEPEVVGFEPEVTGSEPQVAASESELAASEPELAASKSEADAAAPEAVAPDPEAETSTSAAADAAAIGVGLGGPAERFEWKKKREPRAVSRPLYAVAAAALVVGVVLQLVLEYRDALAAHVPPARPLLAAACKPLGCTIGPLRDGAALSIDASDLQADPAHRGLLLLSATIRNRSGHAIAFPYLELMLTDSSDRVVVRRAFPPAEYASGSADLAAGIPANGEHVVRIFLDASATQQAGYRVYLFYP
jgi:predicted Zn finger-like uncharacterized protein